MKLSDTELRKRLLPLKRIGDVPQDYLELVQRGKIPRDLEKALTDGNIILDPFPDDLDVVLGSSSIDLRFGRTVEMMRIPLEVATINGERVIRRLTVDFRNPSEARLLENKKAVAIREGGSWIRFQLEENETLELPPQLLTLAYTLEVICIPHDLEGALQGRSSLARKGVATHITSERFDAGFIGFLTMEVLNQGLANVNIYPGMPFAAMTFHQLSSPATVPYYKKRHAQFSGQR